MGFEDAQHPGYVCHLKKSLYGLKQTLRAWYDTLKSSLVELGFQRCTSDFSLFFKKSATGLLLVLIYVDDTLVTKDDVTDVISIIELIKDRYKLKHIWHVEYLLGVEVVAKKSGFVLSQHKYLSDLLEKTGMSQCHPCASSMAVNIKLSRYDGVTMIEPLLYRNTVGALIYLTLRRPDIAFCVNKLSQFLHSPTMDH